ncbi:hypothetical protein D9M71_660810 [compost metagenome]
MQGLGHTGAAVGQQFVHLGGLPQVSLRITVERGRGLQLRVEVAVVHPTHVGQRGAGADEHIAVLNRAFGALHSLLARVPDGIDVGNVVTGSHQRCMAGRQTRHSDVEQTHCSDLLPYVYKGVVETPAAA